MIQNRGDEAAEWDVWAKQFPIGTNVEGEVLDVWQVGAHIQLDFGPQALLLNSEMRWEGFVPDARVILHKGQRVTVQILSVEPWRQRISVSLRRALNDPWKEYAGSYKKGEFRVYSGSAAASESGMRQFRGCKTMNFIGGFSESRLLGTWTRWN
jgi:ribosomal protein S1